MMLLHLNNRFSNLYIPKVGINAIVFEQGLVCTLLGYFSLVEDDDMVGVANGGKTMGDNDGCFTFCEQVQVFLNGALGFGVNGTCGFVEE